MDIPKHVQKNLKVGDTIGSTNAQYVVEEVSEKRVSVKRVSTGKIVNVSMAQIIKTGEALLKGDSFPYRGIDYTVAKETVIVAALGSMIRDDTEDRRYRLHGRFARAAS